MTDRMAALDHPNIVATFDVIEHNGRLCLVQEWIDGGSSVLSLPQSLPLSLSMRC